ncbi:MAG: hypothetical protein KIS77_05110 [Saprospiraceae bacterium]|nr:hypothetical protein [Saprospiraceae bacterium]
MLVRDVSCRNHLNLPNSINNSADSHITLTYTSAKGGEKLTKISPTETRNYVAGIEYLGTNLEAIYHAEGRCTPNGATAFHYEYTLKDHLGNARVNFRANGTAVTFLEEMHYYPFGMLMEGIGTVATINPNKYRFNGIEQNEELGLNLGLAFYRSYDTALGRWWQVDPKPNFSTSCYSGLANNPLSLSDPLGDTTRVYTTHGKYVGTINDSEENQEHFVSLKRKGVREQKRLIKEANKSKETANKAATVVRGGSKYFIGANTRKDLNKISSVSASEKKERLFALSYTSSNKELRATDLTSKISDRSSEHLNSSQAEAAVTSLIKDNSNLSIIGFGHTHPQERNDKNSNFDMPGLHSPSYPGDYNSLGIVNPIDGGVGNNPSILATRYGYVIYTTADPSYSPDTYEGGPSPAIYNFSGKKIFNLSDDEN